MEMIWFPSFGRYCLGGPQEKKKKECENNDKYLYLRDLKKKIWDIRVTIIPIVIDAFGTITKMLLKRLEDLEMRERVVTMQITTWLRTARILRRLLET